MKRNNARFTMVPLEPSSDQKSGRDRRFSGMVNFC